jgi:hypothetical protein
MKHRYRGAYSRFLEQVHQTMILKNNNNKQTVLQEKNIKRGMYIHLLIVGGKTLLYILSAEENSAKCEM